MGHSSSAAIVYPHQLFRDNPAIRSRSVVYLVEDPLLFTQYKFHKKKLILHRASMKFYADYLVGKGVETRYVESGELSFSGDIVSRLAEDGIRQVAYCDPVDDWLGTRLSEGLLNSGIRGSIEESPMFLNTGARVQEYFGDRRSFSLTHFYREERERRGILLEPDGTFAGGKLTFDTDNRKPLPKEISLPRLSGFGRNRLVEEAVEYVETQFEGNHGSGNEFFFPTTFEEADRWLEEFLVERLAEFGPYEDAIASEESFLFHSVLAPMLNSGLLTPDIVIHRAQKFYEENDVPLNSIEGFVRQIVGWREFIRGIYIQLGRKQRTSNFWGHKGKLPDSFWTGETGIAPVDDCIRKLLANAYNHHIERLMILGNFMVLTEIDPDEAYRWFMEMYIDAYDWVMVPNLYGMSLYADGGLITTKPYISGSNYIRKMSDYGQGDWSEIWDGLYWRFIHIHSEFFGSNPRLRMMPRLLARMDTERKERLFAKADGFLERFYA